MHKASPLEQTQHGSTTAGPTIDALRLKSETPFEPGDVAGMEHVGPMRRDQSTVMAISVAVRPSK